MNFIERFEQLCKESKQTPSAVGGQLGFSRGTVSKWRSGKTMPNGKSLKKIANYFNVSLDYLSGKSNIKNAEDDFEDLQKAKLLLFKTDEVPEKAWREVISFVEYTKKKYSI